MKKPKGPRGGVYIRTSSDQQDQRSQIKRAEDCLRRWGIDQKSVIWIIDTGSRDLSHKRKGYAEMMALVQEGKVQWFLITERDRLGYMDLWELGHILHLFRTAGVELWCVSEDKELTQGGDRFEPILASLEADKSQGEQRSNADRAHRAKRAAVERGEWTGGKAPWGFDLVAYVGAQLLWRLVYEPSPHKRVCVYPDGTSKRFDGKHNMPRRNKGETLYAEPSLDQELLARVRWVFQAYADGWPPHAIATRLNDEKVSPPHCDVWGGPTIQRIIENPAYMGRPAWNKSGQSRFREFVNGQYQDVQRVNGRVKVSRPRAKTDHILAPEIQAIIDVDLWNTCQARLLEEQAAIKPRRPRNPELFLSGLVVCGDCGLMMAGWAQMNAYRCSTNMRHTKRCRCNKARHEILEEIVLLYLEQTERALCWLYDDPDHCQEVLRLEEASQPLVNEYCRKLGQLWEAAKKDGKTPPNDLKVWTYESLKSLKKKPEESRAALDEAIAAREAEKAKLVRRLGLLEDEDAAQAVAARLGEVTSELRELRERLGRPKDSLDALRARLGELLERTAQVRQIMAEMLPRRKAEYIRKLVKEIRVKHEEVRIGKLRASRLIGVDIIGYDTPGPCV
jgi:predicted site-specific integrase-resolvase